MVSLVGKEFGKYRITERIGRGGMADVYLGVHIHLDRPVAIKVLHGHLLEDKNFIERFKREAKAVANLNHPNIVQVHDFDIIDDLIFMVMAYIDGTNLHTRLVELSEEGKHFPLTQVGSIINDIASALDYAHSKGMLHRDVKPSNILLDENGKAYLTDFGIAKIVGDQKLTQAGMLLGTPAYMSPEQGRGDELTEESDIYSLGIVAFEMLTGQVPYDAMTPIGIVQKQITEPIPEIYNLVDDIPSTTQEVIDRALAKSPGSRYSSAKELVGALRIALQALESTEPLQRKPSPKPTEDETDLYAPTIAMQEPDLEKPKAVMEEETQTDPEEKVDKEKPKDKKEAKRKISLWGWITAGVVLLGVAAVVLTQVIGFGQSESGSEITQSESEDITELAGTWKGFSDEFQIIFTIESKCTLNEICGTFEIPDYSLTGDIIFVNIDGNKYEFISTNISSGEESSAILEYLEVLEDGTIRYFSQGETSTYEIILSKSGSETTQSESEDITELAGTWKGFSDEFQIIFTIESKCKLNEVCGTFEISDYSLTGDVIFVNKDGNRYEFISTNISSGEESSAILEYLEVLEDGTIKYFSKTETTTYEIILYKQ